MSFQPKQNNKELSISQETQASEPHVEFDETASSSQLENILGRINAIMTDGPADGQVAEKANVTPDLDPQSTPPQNNHLQNDQLQWASTDNSVPGTQGTLDEKLVQSTNEIETQKDEKFQVSEPLDMLQPYSEVLNEVRDYFNERHSLDPNDSLANSQKPQSISEEVLSGPSVQEEMKKPKKVLLWGDAPLDPQQSDGVGSPLQNVGDKGGETNVADPVEKLSPADFGFGQSEETQLQETSPEETQSFVNKPSIAADLPHGGERNELDQPSQIFSPIKFENPFTRNHTSVDVLGPDDHSGQFKQLRHELVDRIAQLEQVIGHHFGDRKEIANEAAQAAMKLAINNLDDTALGRRLADVETAFILYQKNQAQKNQETQETIDKLGRALMKMETVSQISADSNEAQKLDKKHIPEVPLQSTGEGRAVEKPAVPSSVQRSVPASSVEESKRPSETVGNDVNRSEDYRIDEIQIPTDKGKCQNSGGERADLSSRITDIQPSVDEVPPLLSPEALESFDKKTGEDDSSDKDADAIAKLRQTMSKSASERSFGKPEIETGVDTMSARMSASSSNEKLDGTPSGIHGAHPGGEQGQVRGDDFLAKSATLRDQFKNADIVSKDTDLYTMQPKGVRVIVIVVVIALLLAATGIAFRGKTQGLQDAIMNIVVTVKSVMGQEGSLQKITETQPQSVKSKKEQKEKKAGALDNPKTNDRLGSLTKHNKTPGALLSREPEVTGNIGENGIKLDQPVDQSVLDGGGVKLGMPPALIGPYSLRLAAARGDVRAEYEVARRFSYGLGVPKDAEQAVKWYMQGASKGFAPSQYRLATYYERGRGIEKNLGRAKVWYQRAAMLGNVKAMHNLAVISTALDKEDTDYKAAIYWFKQAANRNLADSQFNLAILYQNGVGLKKNNVKAYKWFSLAARQGDVDAAARRDTLEKKLKKEELLKASQLLQGWRALTIDSKANDVGRISSHITSTMSHAHETVSRSRILTAQILLRKLGYGLKAADGSMNEETIRAVKKFEKDKGLPITGKINPDLIQKLNKASL